MTGYAVPPADAGALAEALTKILREDDVRRQMGIEAKRLARPSIHGIILRAKRSAL